jgi:hypothetical protein
MVVLLLVPYLALAAAMRPPSPFIRSDLHMSSQTFSLTTGLANAC